MDRRAFIRKSVITAGGIGAACGAKPSAKPDSSGPAETAAVPQMKYRRLGRTGYEVSEVCLGTYGWQNTPVLEAALKAGLNLICTCTDYQSGAAEKAIAPALAGNRDRVVLLSGPDCFHMPGEQQLLDKMQESLANLGTDRVDIYVPHQAGSVDHVENPAIPKAFEKMKKAGQAKFLGISTHSSDLEQMLPRAIELGYFDVILCKYNFMEYKSQMEIFARAAENDIGVIVFKIRAGAREKEVEALQKKGLALKQARLRWALSNPNVTSVCSHLSNFSDVEESLEAINVKFSFEDSRLLEEYRLAFDNEYCRTCGTCASRCPQGVDVPSVMRYKMYYQQYGFEKEAIERYATLPEGTAAGPCATCPDPVCESACPHSLSTRASLVQADRLLTMA